AVAEACEAAAVALREPVAGQGEELAGRDVAQDGADGRQLVQRADVHAGADLAAEGPEQRDEGAGEGAGAAAGERPAAGVGAAGEQERERRGAGSVQREDRVAPRAREQGARLGGAEPAPGQGGGRAERRDAEPGEAEWVGREVQDRPEHFAGERLPPLD